MDASMAEINIDVDGIVGSIDQRDSFETQAGFSDLN